MLPAIVLAALIASGLMLSKRDAVSAAPPNAPPLSNPYGDPGAVSAAKQFEAASGAAASRRMDAAPPRTVYSPLRGKNVPVEDMDLGLAPHYRGSAPGPMKERDPARAPDPKRECVEVRGWDSQQKPSMEGLLNKETFSIAGSLSATREGELLMQPMREQRPEPEAVARVLPPSIDVLRGGAKPRFVDTGRIVPGASPVPGRTSEMNVPKRGADGYRTTTVDDMIPNSGPAERQASRPTQVVIPSTARGLGATDYFSPAGAGAPRSPAAYTPSTHEGRFQTPSLPIGGAGMTGSWDASRDMSALEYANSLRDNERQVLPNGSSQSALPMGGMKAGPGASYVTPDMERRDWGKRAVTTSAPRMYGNVRGDTALKQTMYDPNMVMRTTIKETTIHDTSMGIAGPRADRTIARDPDDIIDPTVRDTLASVDSNANLAPPIVKPIVYDPDDLSDPTHRDTLGDAGRTGLPDTMPAGQGYMTSDVDAPNTQRQFQHQEYTGIADAEGGDGYKTADVDARMTQREFVGNTGSQFGPGGSVNSKKSASYAAMYAARMNSIKESVLQGRAPTQVGPKLMKGSQDPDLVVESRRDPYMEANYRQGGNVARQGAVQNPLQPTCSNDTKRVNAVRINNDRHDGFTETAALRTNPYNLDVTRPSAEPVMHRGVR
jgi:hypothetical protein